MTSSPERSPRRQDEGADAFKPLELAIAPGIAARADIETLKRRFGDHELPLGDYVQGLVALRSQVLEQDLLTDTAHRAPSPPAAATDESPAAAAGPAPTPARTPPPEPAGKAPRLSPVCAVLGGRFELEERIGKGGTGDVYRARDLLADQYDREHSTVAVKVLRRDLIRNPPLVREILRAAARMRRLRHPNIAQVFDIQYLDGDYLIVSELLEGQSLAERLDHRAFPVLTPDEVTRVMHDVASALEHAHAQGVVHGDVKPGNVFLTGNMRAMVLDFGFRRPRELGTDGGLAGSLTRLYASPEVLDGQAPTPGDDVYSLAALVYRLATGEWTHGKLDASEAALAGMRPARPSTMPAHQWRALERGLAPQRSARFATVAEFVAAYASIPAQRPAPGLGAAAAAALVAGLCVLAWLASSYWQREPGDDPASVASSIARAPASAASSPARAPVPKPAAGSAPQELLPAPGPQPGSASPSPVVAAPLAAPSVIAEPVTTPDPPALASSAPVQAPARARPAAPAGPARIRLSPTGQVVMSESDPYVRLRLRGTGLRGPVTVAVETQSGSARMNEDFVAPEATVQLTPRRPTAEVLVSLIGDERKENVEDFGVDLSVADGNALLAAGSVVVILTDDD